MVIAKTACTTFFFSKFEYLVVVPDCSRFGQVLLWFCSRYVLYCSKILSSCQILGLKALREFITPTTFFETRKILYLKNRLYITYFVYRVNSCMNYQVVV